MDASMPSGLTPHRPIRRNRFREVYKHNLMIFILYFASCEFLVYLFQDRFIFSFCISFLRVLQSSMFRTLCSTGFGMQLCGQPWRSTTSTQTLSNSSKTSITRPPVPSSSTAAEETSSEQQLESYTDVYSQPPSSTYFWTGSWQTP